MVEKAQEAARLCGLLANENRLLILCFLCTQAMNVSQLHQNICRVCSVSQPALSQHLALLKAHQVISCDKRGQSMVYHITDGKTLRLMHTLREIYCCGGESSHQAQAAEQNAVSI